MYFDCRNANGLHARCLLTDALTNIGLLGAVIFTYVQNLRLLNTLFTIGLVLVGSLFIIQNIVIVIFWFNLYLAGPSIKTIVDAAGALSILY